MIEFRDFSCTKLCANCGNVFARDKRCTWKYWDKAKFCSRQCNADAWSILSSSRRPRIEAAFSRYVTRSDGCWPWSGVTDKDGYGLFHYGKKLNRAPRIALELDGRPVPKGMMACHTCDNPICVRPDHLYPGTPKQNVDDMIKRGRANYGKKLTREQAGEILRMDGDHGLIAEQYGVSRSNISMIKERRIWKSAQ